MLSLLWWKLRKHYGNDAVVAHILILCVWTTASPPGTSLFLVVEVNAMLEDSSFNMGSEVVAQTHEAAILGHWCEDKTLYRVLMPVTEGIGRGFSTLN